MTRAKLHVVTPLASEPPSSNREAESTRRPSVKAPSKAPPAKRKTAPPKAHSGVSELMTKPAVCCGQHDMLTVAAQLMWDNNVGVVVVVDEAQRPVSVVTDRDIAMAAYTQGLPLASIAVASCMAASVQTCKESDAPAQVLEMMQAHQVRRVPVVSASGSVSGVVGLTDLVRAAGKKKSKQGVTGTQVVTTLSGILS